MIKQIDYAGVRDDDGGVRVKGEIEKKKEKRKKKKE